MARFEIEGLDELQDVLESMNALLIDAAVKGMEGGTGLIRDEAKNRVPVDTGQLRNSIVSHVTNNLESIEGTVAATAEHATYVEYGTGPMGEYVEDGFGPINPDVNVSHRPDGWVYKDPKTGNFRYTKGQFARPFMYPAYLAQREAATELIVTAITDAVKQIGKGGDA